jgi:hypothetical protein
VTRLLLEPVLVDRDNVVPAPSDGLAVGDQIVVAGQAGLKDGAKVRLVEGVAEEAPAEAPATDDPLAEREDAP